jgi:hypothetical protein
MLKFIKIIAELFLPLIFIFGVLPIMFRTFKSVFTEDEPKKKKKSKLSHRELMDIHDKRRLKIPPPPPSRRIGAGLEEWEIIDGQIRRRKKKKQMEDTRREVVEIYDNIKRDKGVMKEHPNQFGNEQTKKKHFTKGVDPDFL